jgi:hypothetical protein
MSFPLQITFRHMEPLPALRDAFQAARRKLQDHARGPA